MKIMLTGSNGMVGQWLCARLAETGHTLIATGKRESINNPTYLNDNFRYKSMDITHPSAVHQLVTSQEPDLIIHSAAITQVDDCELNRELAYSVNVDGTALLLAAAKQVGSSFCYLSTDFVFSGQNGPYKEDAPRNPVNFYGETKRMAEDLVQESGLKWSIARTILLYGKTLQINRSNFIYWVKDNLVANKPIKVVDDQVRTPTYLPDLVDGITTIAEKKATGIFHLSGKDTLTPYKMALVVAEHLNLNSSLITPVTASSFTQVGTRPLRTGFIIEKAKKELGYAPKGFKETLDFLF
jgi:dTDP-4-dehydrorhamnose reductase